MLEAQLVSLFVNSPNRLGSCTKLCDPRLDVWPGFPPWLPPWPPPWLTVPLSLSLSDSGASTSSEESLLTRWILLSCFSSKSSLIFLRFMMVLVLMALLPTSCNLFLTNMLLSSDSWSFEDPHIQQGRKNTKREKNYGKGISDITEIIIFTVRNDSGWLEGRGDHGKGERVHENINSVIFHA